MLGVALHQRKPIGAIHGHDIAQAMVEEELSGLTPKERETLADLLQNVKQRLQEMSLDNDPIDSTELEKINAE